MVSKMRKRLLFHIVLLIGLVANGQRLEVEKLNNSGIDKIIAPSKAEQLFRKASAIDTTYAEAPYNLGTTLYQENYIEEAFGHLKEAANRSSQPDLSHKAFHNIGNVYMQKEEYDNAIEAYKQALRYDPTDEETRYNLALAKKKKEEQQQEQNQDQDQQDQQDQQENEENKENDQEDKEGDQGDSKEKEKESEDEKGDGSEKEEQKKGQGDQKQEQGKRPEDKQPQGNPKPQELSKQQIENLLQALQNEENKVQEKMNAKKVQGRKLKVEKDW